MTRYPNGDTLYTIQQVMARLQVSDETVYRYIRAGKLRAIKVGWLWRVSKTALDAFLEKGRMPDVAD